MAKRCLGLFLFAACLAAALKITAAPAQEQGRVRREKIEWCDIWITNADQGTAPRALLIGDSISRGYYPVVEKALGDKVSLGRLATSAALGSPELLESIKMVLGQYRFDVIHFNVGLHGWDYTEAEYKAHFPELIATIRKYAPKAKLIWATTTPVRVKGDVQKLESRTERVKERNRVAGEIVEREKIPVDDLFSVVIDHPEFQSSDGVHYNAKGYAAIGAQVAQKIEEALRK